MGPHDRRTALVGEDRNGYSRRDRTRDRLGIAENPPEKALARSADEDGTAEGDDLVESPQELEVVLNRFSEADAGIETDVVLRDPSFRGEGEPLLQEGDDFGDDIVVARILLHRPGLAEHVHETEVRLGIRDDASEIGVAAESGDVVDHHGAGFEGTAGDLRIGGVNRNRHPHEVGEDGLDSAQLLLERHRLGARAGGLAAHVDDGGAFLHETVRARHRSFHMQEGPAVGKGVGRHVDDAHHARARKKFIKRGSQRPPYPMLQALIDLHSHILPGVDDGARTLEDSRALAERSAAEGVTAIAATPHVRGDYPTTAGEMERRVAALREDFREQAIAIEVLHGGEIDLGMLEEIHEDDLRRFSLAQTGLYLLLETPYYGWPLGIAGLVHDLAARGFRVVLAHPERNAQVQADASRLEPLIEQGALIQVTAASVDGRLGRSSKRTAERLIELGMVHLIASDAHPPDLRAAGLAAAATAVRDRGLARYLTEEAPAAIVAGESLGRPPAARRRRFVLF
jgi:protein-tyrosine phosphatase